MIDLSTLPIVREPSDDDRFLAESMAPHVEPVPLNIARAEYLAAKMQPDADLAWFLARLIRAGYIATLQLQRGRTPRPKTFRLARLIEWADITAMGSRIIPGSWG